MRKPSRPGAPMDAKRYRGWVNRFGSFREPINNISIEGWLDQFDTADRDLAARVLDSVDFYGQSQIAAAFRQSLGSLPGWDLDPAKRKGKWRFSAMSGGVGESGDAMLYHFRVANRLDSRKYDDLFVHRSDLFRQPLLPEDDPHKLGPDDVVVLIDDFSGTGKQVCNAWNDPVTSFGALLAGVGTVYLIVVAASKRARERILAETSLRPLPAHEFRECDNIFSDECSHFTAEDRKALLRYCRRADKRIPRGFGDCGLLVVFQHRPPNNSIPILHANNGRWIGLFPRFD